ncbi:DNA replication/repair protein RecF [Roseofilum capinflatum]|uniref:DNA replication and repair protein RecF n=1 Tax=Roseofilum capinflatum BLCC-M114 TaxID=3022440 RepID=A0ABT7B2J8_9CYAN|nr:DNA replication/repair protein RecF [Roseofilum capinflatum]MDJ1173387.1 DNA replication/repair protein RecF [Roseofilum capinflatum BLCC-M114]
MYLKHLYLKQFRNYVEQAVSFLAPKVILVGDNAQGKSNLLEAVELLSTLRSHRAKSDRDLVLQSPEYSASMAQVSAVLERQTGEIDLKVVLRASGNRTLVLNQETQRRRRDFLGALNVVQFSSLDLDLVRGSPENRRLWLDTLLTQLEPVYDPMLRQYQQILRQRNALLRQFQEVEGRDASQQLALWDAQLVSVGLRLIRRRARVLERLAPIAQAWHDSISGSREKLSIAYNPSVFWDGDSRSPVETIERAFFQKLRDRAIAEHAQGTTLVGPHRDEVDFYINGTPARQYGSQGQQRTLVLSLKLAELKLISEVVGESPLLLLDDVLAELDLMRQNQLLEAIADRFQTLITTTHLSAFEQNWLHSSQILRVQDGHICSQGD